MAMLQTSHVKYCFFGNNIAHQLLYYRGVIYIYTRTCVHDGTEMWRNLFVDLLVHERNRYRRFLAADIKHYLRRIMKRSIK